MYDKGLEKEKHDKLQLFLNQPGWFVEIKNDKHNPMIWFLHGSKASWFSYAHELHKYIPKISVSGEMKNKDISKEKKLMRMDQTSGEMGTSPSLKVLFRVSKVFETRSFFQNRPCAGVAVKRQECTMAKLSLPVFAWQVLICT